MSKVLVTGGHGFCGRKLVQYLRAQGQDVYTIGRPPTQGQHYHLADVADVAVIAQVCQAVRPDYLFHLAGVSSASLATTFYQVNTRYSAAILQALEQSGLADTCVTLFVGTSAEYGAIEPEQVPIHERTPVSPYHHYGISKLAQTHIGLAATRMGRPVVMLRPFNIIGPGMPAHLSVQSFATQVAQIVQGQKSPVIEVGNLGSSRDFIDVDTVLPMYWQLIQTPKAHGQIINICSGQPVVMSDLLQQLIELARVDVEVKVDPQRFKALDIPVHYGCTQKLSDLLGPLPEFELRPILQRVLDHRLTVPQPVGM